MNQIKERLKELTALVGVSSREDEVVQYMYKHLKAHFDDVEVDMLGNVTARFLSGQKDAQRVLFFGHMDEVGLIVKKVEDDGFLRLERVSAVNNHVLPGSILQVRTHKGTYVKGVVGAKSHHLMSPAEKDKMPDLSVLALDIGCRSREEAAALDITEGCIVAYTHNFVEMGNNLISTKSLDDRMALVVLLALAEHAKGKKLPFDLYLIASVQEEFNIRGIMPAARKVDADVAIGIDISPAGDSPDAKGATYLTVGKGPAFTYLNYHGRGTLNGIVPNEALVHFLESVCQKGGIAFQREICRGVLTETSYIAISGDKGVATANISVPTRYAHTPVEVLSLDDLAKTIELVCGFVDQWDGQLNLKKISF